MATLSELQFKLQDMQDQKSKLEKKLEEANKQYKGGLWGILIGILLLPLYGLGLIFLVAGILAVLTNRGKRSRLQKEIKKVDNNIQLLRSQILKEEANLKQMA